MKKIEKLKNIGKSCPGVYALVNHSKKKCYIGQTKNLKDRIACHVNTLDTGKHHCKELQEDYSNGDKIEIIILAETKEYSDDRKCLEDYYIMCLHERNIGLYNDLGQAKSDKNFFYRASFLDSNVGNLIKNIRLQ